MLDPIYSDGREFLGWYDESLKIKYQERSINKYSENLDLYSKYEIFKEKIIELKYTITDSGRFNQKYDTLDLKEIIGYSIKELKEMDYKKIQSRLILSMNEIDKGYQYVFLYDGESKYSNMIVESNQICVSNKEYNSIEVIFNINLEEIPDTLYIRFGASGNGSDDWVTNYRQYYITVMGE